MKKIFTLVAAAFAAVAVNAADWTPDETAPAAGTAVVDDDLVTISTVFTTTNSVNIVNEVPTPVTFAGKTFNTYTQIRVEAAPSAATPTGTQQSGSTPLVIVAKKNVNLTYYYRRQAASGAYADNDGKDIKIVDQASPAAAIAGTAFVAEDIDGDYANTYKTVALAAGKTYTLWARGTTGRLYGISYEEGTAGGGEDVDPGTAGGDIPAGWGDVYSWEGGADGATEVGGTAVATYDNAINVVNGDNYVIIISKKKADIDTDNVQITFNEALKAGDKIAITGYRNKDNDANGTLYMLFSNDSSIDEGDNVVWNNIHDAVGQQPNTNVYDVTDAIAGSTSVKIARSKASTNVFITKIRVARAGGTGVQGVKAADEAAQAVKKVVKNGQIIIVKGGAEYNAAGAQVK